MALRRCCTLLRSAVRNGKRQLGPACAEARAVVPEVQTAVVERAIWRDSAVFLSKQIVGDLIKEAARKAARRVEDVPPYVVESPESIQVEYLRNDAVEKMLGRERVAKLSPRRVRYTGADVREAVRRWCGG